MHMARSILLVEDNPMDIDLTQRAFARRNLSKTIEVARDGQEALDCLARWEAGAPPPMLVLMDINLPKVSGLDVLLQLRAHPTFGQLPVVMLTTSDEDEDVKRAYARGANSYIVKPVSFENFVEIAAQIDLYWLVLNTPPLQSRP